MITTTQKAIVAGSSLAVTIPAKEARNAGIVKGTELKVTIELVNEKPHDQLMREYQEFKKQYHETLKNLSGR